MSSGRAPRTVRGGFTLVETLIYTVVASVLLLSVVRLMTRQGRGYTQGVASGDVDESARDVGATLAWELRHAGMAGDTLLGLFADSIRLRSVQGVGIVCAKHASQARYGIWKRFGDIAATVDDSALAYSSTKQAWRKMKVSAVGTGAALGVPACAWADGRAPDLVVQVSAFTATDTSGIVVGSPFRAYRSAAYGQFQEGGRWWFGRKVSGGPWEKLTGPLRAESPRLSFTYYGPTGAVTTVASAVSSVQFEVHTESYKLYRGNDGVPAYRYDSLTTRIMLRK